MDDFFVLALLLSPVFFVIGMVNPALLTKLFGKIPTRLAVAKVSGALFVGSFIGVGATLEAPSPAIEETIVEETAEAPDLAKPLAEESLPDVEAVPTEQSTPEIETPSVYVEPEPTVEEEPVYIPPVVEAEPEPQPTTPSYICSYNAYNCSDFSSWYEANQVYNYCLSVGAGDIHDLDRDNDGACDSLK